MPKRSKIKVGAPAVTLWMMLYMGLSLLELFYIFMLWSSYGNPDGKLKEFYIHIKRNINNFVLFGLIGLVLLSFVFPGIGWMAFIVTLWRVAEMCCSQKEGFGDGLHYGWGRYYPDSATFFNQAIIEREQDGTRAAYSSAVGDNKDAYWIAQLADYENRIAHQPVRAMRRKKMVFEKDGCGNGQWIIPKIKDKAVTGCMDYLCDGGCRKCSIQKYGNLFETLNTPRPLYTTSLLAKEMDSA